MRLGLLLQGVLLSGFAGLLIVWGIRTTMIRCQRDAAIRCSYDTWPFGVLDDAFEPTNVEVAYRKSYGKGGQSSEHGRVVLIDVHGARHASLEADYAHTLEVGNELRRFLTHGAERRVRVFVHGSPWIAAFGLFAAWIGAVCLRVALQGSGRVRLELGPDRRTLHIRRTFLGLGLPGRTLELVQPSAVTIERREIKNLWRSRHERVEQGARVCIQTANGSLPLLETYARGDYVHERFAAELRESLGLPAQLPVAPPARRPATASSILMTIWLGICIGSLLGIGLGAVGALTIGQHRASDSADGPWYFGGLGFGLVGGIIVALLLERRSRQPD